MRHHGRFASSFAVLLGFTLLVGSADAACLGDKRPAIAKKIDTALVPAFESCTSGSAMTESNDPACQPPRTEWEVSGSPPNGWKWGNPQGATGNLKIDDLVTSNTATADVRFRLTLAGVVDGTGMPANGAGTLSLHLRLTADDPVGPIMTAVDLPVTLPFALVNGSTALDTTLDTYVPGIVPQCHVTEVVLAEVYDATATLFAVPGLYLPLVTSVGTANCDFQQPGEAFYAKMSLVGPFLPCVAPTTQTALSFPACAPEVAFWEQAGDPPGTWKWDYAHSKGTVTLKIRTAKKTDPPVPDARDVGVKIELKEIHATPLAAGFLRTIWRFTTKDRVGGDMTAADQVIDIPFNLDNDVINQDVSYSDRLNTRLIASGKVRLPSCTVAELVDLQMFDTAGNFFARIGVRAKSL